jgi:hypothetical protein
MLTLQVGEPRSDVSPLGRPREVGAYALHIQCPWRLTEGTRIVAGSGDLSKPADPSVDRETWNWDDVGATWWDDRMREFFRSPSHQIKVQTVMADAFGGFRLICSGAVTFEVFPNESAAPHDVSEYWRLLQPSRSAGHFVVLSTGLEA